jgi:hypothetical protein
LRIHFTAALEREAAHIMQVLDSTKAAKEDGYAISEELFHGDLLPSNDAQPRPRWELKDISSDSFFSVPFDNENSSGLGNGFEKLISY